MNTDHIYEFLVLANTKNFSRAAEKLFLTQSTLSRHIKELEAELGEALFLRDSHTVELTAKGRLFAREAAVLNKAYGKLIRQPEHRESEASTPIRIGCSSTALSRTLQHFLDDFVQNHSQYTFEIELLSDLEMRQPEHSYDLLFSPFEYQTHTGMARQDCTIWESACIAINMRNSANGPTENLPDFAGITLLLPYIDELFCSYAYNRQYVEHVTTGKLKVVPVRNVETALLCVQQDKGATIIPRHIAKQHLSDVIYVSVKDKAIRFNTFLYAKETLDYDFLNTFVDALNSRFRKVET